MSVADPKQGRAGRIFHRLGSGPAGFTLVEILLAVLIIGLAIAPILDAFAPALQSAAAEEQMAVLTNQARATLNRILDMDYASVSSHLGNPVDLAALFGSAAEAARETVTVGAKTFTPKVVIADASGGTGELVEITVTMGEVALATLRSQ